MLFLDSAFIRRRAWRRGCGGRAPGFLDAVDLVVVETMNLIDNIPIAASYIQEAHRWAVCPLVK